jgi:transcriptional regulator with XRE-family HTH domain
MPKINLDRQQKLYQFGIRLRKIRESLGMTQKCLADDTGLSQGAIHQFEAGIKPLTVDALVCLYHSFKRSDPTMTTDRVLGLVDENGKPGLCELGEYMYPLLLKDRKRGV